MALNSFITRDGLEIGRAQAVQARAAGVEPSVYMNPILLKPVSDMSSQVIINGKVLGNMKAKDYFAYKKQLIPDIKRAFQKLEEQADIIVIEGAGSPAEINLKADDIVNMGLASLVNAPVLLVGDIDRGGVFAQLLGTMMLLEPEERDRVRGLVINKFRGDKSLLDPGIRMLEERAGVPVAGVVPYRKISIEEEDSLSEKFMQKEKGLINLAVIRFPRISNYTDFDAFERIPGVTVRYVTKPEQLEAPDAVFLPGTKNTIADLLWMRQNGLEAAIRQLSKGTPVFGICGGFQMLGESVADPFGTEEGGCTAGIGLLPVRTVLKKEKVTKQVQGVLSGLTGIFQGLNGSEYQGYEIHTGETAYRKGPEGSSGTNSIVVCAQDRPVYGSYVHGLFDGSRIAWRIAEALAAQKGVNLKKSTGWQERDIAAAYQSFQETQYDLLADMMRSHMDMQLVYESLREAAF